MICTSPRTGSNLLVDSLAQHPYAICAGEICCPDALEEYKANQSKAFNLAKLFASDQHHPGFRDILDGSLKVFLYRIDRKSQITSWLKACRTGQWVAEVQGRPISPPIDPDREIQETHQIFEPMCDMKIAYEDLIRDWDGTIASVLREAGWEPKKLPMARQRLL